MLRVLFLCALCLSVVGCDSKAPTPAAVGVAAGKVLEVSGTVSVRHGDVVQPLAKGASLEADDTIETGADGHAVIELVHNLARWDLGPNKKTKLRESIAWTLAKHEGSAAIVEQDTTSAGRPAERTAVDTTTSANGEGGTDPKPDTAAGKDSASDKSGAKNESAKDTDKDKLGIGTIGKGGGTGVGTGYGAGGGSVGGRRGGKPNVKLGASKVEGALDKAVIERIIKQRLPQIRFCYEKQLARDPALAGRVTARFTIDGKGAVLAASASGIHPEIEACVTNVIKRAQFPAPQGGGEVTVTYPFLLRPD